MCGETLNEKYASKILHVLYILLIVKAILSCHKIRARYMLLAIKVCITEITSV